MLKTIGSVSILYCFSIVIIIVFSTIVVKRTIVIPFDHLFIIHAHLFVIFECLVPIFIDI